MTLQLVVLGEGGVHEEVERAHGGHGPEVVEVALVEVVGDPPWTTPRGRERRHDGVDRPDWFADSQSLARMLRTGLLWPGSPGDSTA